MPNIKSVLKGQGRRSGKSRGRRIAFRCVSKSYLLTHSPPPEMGTYEEETGWFGCMDCGRTFVGLSNFRGHMSEAHGLGE
jgi:hypothetical protein